MSRAFRVFDDPGSLAQAFAGELAARIRGAAGFSIALSGGGTPRLALEALARHAAGIDWKAVHFFWGDERCVPPDHADSNYRMAREALFDTVDIPGGNIHRIMGERNPEAEAARYAGEMLATLPLAGNIPRFDLVMLGLGEDGHTASIFPGNIGLLKSGTLCEVSVHPMSGQKRITLTGKVFGQATQVAFLVTGSRKSSVVKEILEHEKGCEAYPAAMLYAMRDDAMWWLDKEAASMSKVRG
jgi:6-phosphogluconolactonase